ncbi:MAG: FkbM family methyltransferase [Gammaproteobacteria bacterium]|jgi:FkbM family methyltransferase|nr:FkbM family methyltransferase [Gammaproteobacteria bacterium]MBT4494498.1 FkbM family methyltransferase [Gammaproteobacteria bacterium]
MTKFNKTIETRFGPMIYNENDQYIGQSLASYGEFSFGETDLFDQLVSEGMFVIEIGANIGAHTIMLAQKVASAGRVIAFEPQRIVYQTLCGNLALNSLLNVEAYQFAIGSKSGTLKVPPLDYSQKNNFGGLSLGESLVGEAVELRTLDSFNLSRCDFLKIDIEGMEEDALRGGADTIRRLRPMMYVENDRKEKSQQLGSFIQSLGYKMFWHFPPLYNANNFKKEPKNVFGNIVSSNLVCIPKEREASIKGLKPFFPKTPSRAARGDETEKAMTQGEALNQTGDSEQTRIALERALERNGTDIEAMSLLALVVASLGDMKRSEELFNRAINIDPQNPVIHSNLGGLMFQSNRLEEAVACYDQAISLRPGFVDAWTSRGAALSRLGQMNQALESYEEALRIDPEGKSVLTDLGSLLRRTGQFGRAADTYDRLIRMDPANVDARRHHSNVLNELGRFDEALVAIHSALNINSDNSKAHYAHARVLRSLGELDQGLAAYDEALRLDPDDHLAQMKRGNLLGEMGRYDEYLIACEQVIAVKPGYAPGHNEKGAALFKLERFDKAIECYRRAIELQPDLAQAYVNLGTALGKVGRLDEGVEYYDKALTFESNAPEVLFCKGLLLLQSGQFKKGLPLYEHRWEGTGDRTHPNRPSFAKPLWTGKQDLKGKTIFVHCEQGLGDVLQFCRYINLLKDKGASVVFKVHKPLVPLLEQSPVAALIIDDEAALPVFDYHCPMLSLPLAFGTTLETIPTMPSYLSVNEERVERWRSQIDRHRINIGINWQGKKSVVDIGRSFPLSLFSNIADMPKVQLYSLQQNVGIEQLAEMPEGMEVESFDDSFDNEGAFLDTAAVMKNLDLVITSDTSVAHLAGGLGCTVWLVLKKASEWRWLLNRDTSPWYPSMKLFRQSEHGDWESAFAMIEAELNELLDVQSQNDPAKD